jgi:myo-inositol-1(or 4)-monophosphatase
MPIDPSTIAFAHRLADAAGEVIRPYFRKRIEVIDKGEAMFDPVTAADKAKNMGKRRAPAGASG